MAKNDYRTYATAYKNIVKNKIPVIGCKYDVEVSEIIKNTDDFKQCYKKGDPVREELPRYWFISKEGFLISVRNKMEPKWIKPNLKASRPEFNVSRKGKTQNVTVYTLVAIVWDSARTKNAQKILNERGLKGLGKLKKEKGQHVAKVQGHHVKNYIKESGIDSYIANNDPTNIQLVTVREHDVLNKIQEGKTDVSIFYQPSFMNIPNNAVQVYDLDTPRILDPSETKIAKVLGVTFAPREEDSILTEKYIFVLENGRKKLEELKPLLIDIAEKHPPKFKDIRLNQIPFIVEGIEYIIFYQFR